MFLGLKLIELQCAYLMLVQNMRKDALEAWER